jgi:hypothetical protein
MPKHLLPLAAVEHYELESAVSLKRSVQVDDAVLPLVLLDLGPHALQLHWGSHLPAVDHLGCHRVIGQLLVDFECDVEGGRQVGSPGDLFAIFELDDDRFAGEAFQELLLPFLGAEEDLIPEGERGMALLDVKGDLVHNSELGHCVRG